MIIDYLQCTPIAEDPLRHTEYKILRRFHFILDNFWILDVCQKHMWRVYLQIKTVSEGIADLTGFSVGKNSIYLTHLHNFFKNVFKKYFGNCKFIVFTKEIVEKMLKNFHSIFEKHLVNCKFIFFTSKIIHKISVLKKCLKNST